MRDSLKVQDLAYNWGDWQLNVDFELSRGDSLVVLGASGCGKTTLLQIIAGFLKAKSGDLIFANQDLAEQEPSQRPITTLFQEHNLFNHLNVRDNVALGLSPSLKLSAEQWQRVDHAVERVGLGDKSRVLPASLSGGQKQRAGLARSLARQRPILLLDEPFSALDPALRKSMLNQVRELQAQERLVLIMVSHFPEDAVALGDKVLLMEEGQMAFFGKAEELERAIAQPDAAPQVLRDYLG